MKKRIVITGISGFIGSVLAKHLSMSGYYIVGIDRHKPSSMDKEYIDEFYNVDIKSKLPDIDDIFGVVHLAGRTGVRESNAEFFSYLNDNVYGTKNLLDTCVTKWKPLRCIITSSSSVYGDTDFPENPKSPYALTKYYVEKLVEMYKILGLIDDRYTIIRPFTVYGPSSKPRKNMVIYKFIESALTNKPLEIYGGGLQSRDFTYVNDICEAIKRLLETENKYFDSYDLGTASSYSLFDVAGIISKILKKDLKIIFKPEDPLDVKKTIANVGNLWETTGYIPETRLEDGIKKTIDWFRDRKESVTK